jgi:hypothetical protein
VELPDFTKFYVFSISFTRINSSSQLILRIYQQLILRAVAFELAVVKNTQIVEGF